MDNIYKAIDNIMTKTEKHKLPVLLIDKSILVPIPSNFHEIEIEQNEFLVTQKFQTKNESYDDAFIFAFTDSTSTVLEIGLLCSITNQQLSQGKLKIQFSSMRKVEQVKLTDNSYCEFELSKSVLDKENIVFLDSFISRTSSHPMLKGITQDSNTSSFSKAICINKILMLIGSDNDLLYRYIKSSDWYQKICVANLILDKYYSDATIDFSKENVIDANKTGLPEHVNAKLAHEKKRLSMISPSSQEYSATQDYVELLEKIPWTVENEEVINVQKIKEDLSKSHYGLDTIKNEILDFYALKELTGVTASSCLLFSGPPGTGKTTIAKSIANSTGRDLIVIALGGVSDESEFRGHRRTYTGARPGRIVSAFANAKSMNPIILLDEIDKISTNNSKGDPFGALLEILDPEQNKTFIDRFLEIPFDLSKCSFICTANDINNIPEPIMDRLDNIKFIDYTPEQKINIINNYIIKKVCANYKMEKFSLSFSNELIEYLANEFNLRKITREFERLYRKAASTLLTKEKNIEVIDLDFYHTMYEEEIVAKPTKKKRIGF